jgi:hypothetical protein
MFLPGSHCPDKLVRSKSTIDLEAFISQYQQQRACIDDEKLVNRLFAGKQLIEEHVLTLQHSETISWLLPGVRPTKKKIQLPMVMVV